MQKSHHEDRTDKGETAPVLLEISGLAVLEQNIFFPSTEMHVETPNSLYFLFFFPQVSQSQRWYQPPLWCKTKWKL